MANAEEGSLVYSVSDFVDVILVEKPQSKYGPCKYKFVGKDQIFKKDPSHFRNISKSNIHIFIEFSNKSELVSCMNRARSWGFRVELMNDSNNPSIKIYGDNQEELFIFEEMHKERAFYLY